MYQSKKVTYEAVKKVLFGCHTRIKNSANRENSGSMTRTIVVRTCQPSFGTTTLASKNVNDEIGLAPFLSYTVAEHLEDLASDGLTVVSAEGNSYRFSDGSAFRLEQRVVSVSESRLDLETLRLVTIAKIVDRRREITQAIGA